jgi:hypothetical protein
MKLAILLTSQLNNYVEIKPSTRRVLTHFLQAYQRNNKNACGHFRFKPVTSTDLEKKELGATVTQHGK